MSSDGRYHDPAWFPDRIDPDNRLIRLVRTSHARLADSAFLDGRTPIATGEAQDAVVPLDRFVAALAGDARPLGWIFHHSFCGSTLLARTATIEGIALCLREPQVLVDLANWRLTLRDGDRPLYAATIAAVRAKLAQRWRSDEAVLVKPTNWVNPIVADLWRPDAGDRAMVATIAVEDFLVAVLRGGRDRIAYTLRVHQQIVAAWPLLDTVIAAQPAVTGDALSVAIALVAAMHWAQRCVLVARCRAAGIDPASVGIGFPGFLADPTAVGDRMARAFDMPLAATRFAASLDQARSRHAKGDRPFAGSEADSNATIRRLHGAAIAAALEWHRGLEPDTNRVIAAIAAEMAAGDRVRRGNDRISR